MDSALTELLGRLVSIPSVNPEDTHDPAITGELRMADFLGAYLGDRGFDVIFPAADPQRPNLVASYGPDQPRRTLLIEAHTDTVSVQGMSIPPFEPRVENGRLYGRGACDTKGPMAAALHAMQPERLEKLARRGVKVLFVGAMGEEKGNHGAEYLVAQGMRADEAVILEPTDLALVVAHKGAWWLRVTLEGRAGHGSAPEQACSAVSAAARFIQAMEAEMASYSRAWNHELLGKPTLNIGKINGGSAVNIVPDHCVLELDRRLLPGEDRDEQLGAIEALLQTLKADEVLTGYGLEVIKASAPYQTDPDGPLARQFRKAAEVAEVPFRVAGTPWYSDAGPFSASCGETVVFGPGSIQQAHTADEFIALDSLDAGCRMLGAFLDRAGR